MQDSRSIAHRPVDATVVGQRVAPQRGRQIVTPAALQNEVVGSACIVLHGYCNHQVPEPVNAHNAHRLQNALNFIPGAKQRRVRHAQDLAGERRIRHEHTRDFAEVHFLGTVDELHQMAGHSGERSQRLDCGRSSEVHELMRSGHPTS